MEQNTEIFELITKMYSEMQDGFKSVNTRIDKLDTKVDNLESKVDSLEIKVTKNSILLEKVDRNVKLLAEGQESFREQIGRSNTEDKRTISDRLNILELSVKSTSSDVKAQSKK